MKENLKLLFVNFLKFFIITAVGVLLLFMASIAPETKLAGTTLPHFLSALVTVFAIMTCTATTERMFGAAFLSFGLPVLSYFFIGLFSPIFIAPHIVANFFMVFFYNILGKQKKNHIHRAASYLFAGFVRFGCVYVFAKLGEKFIEYIMIFKNVTDPEGLQAAIAQMQVDSLNGQFIATFFALILSYGVVMLIKSFSKNK